jgi:hypothetical protein
MNIDQAKKIILEVSNGEPASFPLLHALHGCRNGIHLIDQCRKSGIIGKSFVQMWQDNGGSKARVVSYLLKKITKDPNRKLQIKDLG